MNDALRSLHEPSHTYAGLRCEGCDFEPNYEGESPAWPCRTAEIVYDADEIAAVTSAYRWWSAWGRDREARKRLASGWGAADDQRLMFRDIYSGMVHQMLRPALYFDSPSEGSDTAYGTTVTFTKIANNIQVSKEFLR